MATPGYPQEFFPKHVRGEGNEIDLRSLREYDGHMRAIGELAAKGHLSADEVSASEQAVLKNLQRDQQWSTIETLPVNPQKR